MKIRSITGKVKFNGKGSINNDSNEQKWILQKMGFVKGKINYNCTFHKKSFYENEDGGGYLFRYKVSHDCLRHGMFMEEMPYYNGGLAILPQVLYNSIATPHMIARGYMFADKTLSKTIKKKSPFTITDGLSESEHDTVIMDVNSRSGERGESVEVSGKDENGDNKTEKKGATTFFFSENVGNHIYNAEFGINMDELQFIPLDDFYGRCAADVSRLEYKELYCSALKRNFGTGEDVEIKPYYLKTSIMGEECAEEGILLSEKMVDKVVRLILEKIIKINITRPSHGGLLVFDSMEITLNYSDGSSKTVSVNGVDDLEGLFFGYEQVYLEADDERIRRRDEEISRMNQDKKTKKAKKNKNNGENDKNDDSE